MYGVPHALPKPTALRIVTTLRVCVPSPQVAEQLLQAVYVIRQSTQPSLHDRNVSVGGDEGQLGTGEFKM